LTTVANFSCDIAGCHRRIIADYLLAAGERV
jgi:hypothetical protein